MNAFAYIFTAWVPIFTFPTWQQPYIVAGNYITAGFGFCAVLTVLTMRHFYERDVREGRNNAGRGALVEDSEGGLSLGEGEVKKE